MRANQEIIGARNSVPGHGSIGQGADTLAALETADVVVADFDDSASLANALEGRSHPPQISLTTGSSVAASLAAYVPALANTDVGESDSSSVGPGPNIEGAVRITSAIHHATGVRVRELAIKIEDLIRSA